MARHPLAASFAVFLSTASGVARAIESPLDPVLATVAIGAVDPARPDTVVVVCSGTLVRRDVVLTAAHCEGGYDALLPRIALTHVLFGERFEAKYDKVTLERGKAGVRAVGVHVTVPQPRYASSRHLEADIALLALAQEAPQGWEPVGLVDPLFAFTFCETSGHVGGSPCTKALVMGYGQSPNPGGDGTRKGLEGRILFAPESFVEDTLVVETAGGNVCEGDSGGPTFVLEPTGGWAIAGLHRDTSEDCNAKSGFNYDTWVGTYRGWIEETLQGLPRVSPRRSR